MVLLARTLQKYRKAENQYRKTFVVFSQSLFQRLTAVSSINDIAAICFFYFIVVRYESFFIKDCKQTVQQLLITVNDTNYIWTYSCTCPLVVCAFGWNMIIVKYFYQYKDYTMQNLIVVYTQLLQEKTLEEAVGKFAVEVFNAKARSRIRRCGSEMKAQMVYNATLKPQTSNEYIYLLNVQRI